jgi:hypothetical protein
MHEAQTYTLAEAHLHFARTLNGEVWHLLEKPERTQIEEERLIHAAHASCYHWLHAGTGVHHQRAQWLIARVYGELGLAGPALRHASRCLALTGAYADLLEPFDRAYAYEAVARANALAGNRDEARQYIRRAAEAATTIADDEDRRIFLDDFHGGNWHGLRV